MLALLSGCQAGPAASSAVDFPFRTSAWAFQGAAGQEIRTDHYLIRTTVTDRAVVGRCVRVLETAYAQYAALVPPAANRSASLPVYFFARPDEWDAFTQQLTGPDAAVYLSVGPGGYAYGDTFVCWLFNENDLWSVVAHEGLHQYAARHLAQRLPPVLEEGLATTFETVEVTDRSVTIDRRSNARRQQGLADAGRAGCLLPWDDLIKLHAGDIAGRDLVIREGFYGQCWALARVMLETPAYAGGLRAMLLDLRDGRSPASIGATAEGTLYRPAGVKPMLQKYIAPDWTSFRHALTDWTTAQANSASGSN
ncbi:MAG: hypothetical protein QM754_16910 [Tepidisphaeraceae bacterium]